VDREIICLGILFVVVIGLYAGFEKVIINYRPVLMPGEMYPEASYPSSHTMLVITVLGATMALIKRYLGEGFGSWLLRLACFAVILVTIVGRLYSGYHWFTDIVGGVLLSLTLIELYLAVIAEPAVSKADKGYKAKH
jgi:undecaprenyl-diphosphatase